MEEITFFMRVHSVREVREDPRPEPNSPIAQEWEVRADTDLDPATSLFYRTHTVADLPRADSVLRVTVIPQEGPVIE